MKWNKKMLLVALASMGLLVTGCAGKKHDLSTIEAQKAQHNASIKHSAENTYQMADQALQQQGNNASAATRQSVLDAMARLKAALAANDINAIQKAEQELKASMNALKAEASSGNQGQASAMGAHQVMKPESNSVYFDFDSARLKGAAGSLLDAYAAWLNANQDVRVTIEGNCDQRGSREYNLALGQQRADSVKAYLVQRGVDASRMDTVSFGEERPVCRGTGEACWAQNRHADIVSR